MLTGQIKTVEGIQEKRGKNLGWERAYRGNKTLVRRNITVEWICFILYVSHVVPSFTLHPVTCGIFASVENVVFLFNLMLVCCPFKRHYPFVGGEVLSLALSRTVGLVQTD